VKILLTVHQFLPEFGAGTEILTFEVAKGLQRLGHEVCVFTGFNARRELRDEDRFDEYVYEGILVKRFHHAYVPMGGQNNVTEAEYRNLLVARYFRNLLEKMNPDVVHFFHLARLSASLVEVCSELGIPTVLTPTDFWFVCPTNQLRLSDGSMCRGPGWNATNCVRHLVELNQPEDTKAQIRNLSDWRLGLTVWANQRGITKSGWYGEHIDALTQRHVYLREQFNKIDRVLVPTHLMERILTSNGLSPDGIVFAPYGLNLTYLRRHPRTATRDLLRIGFIGTLYEHKGVDVLVKAVSSLDVSLPVELKIFGDTKDFPVFFARLKELAGSDPRIQFCGTFPNLAIGEILASLDVLVVPSVWYENTPLVIYSAQAAGCPVIASNLGGMAEVIHHEDNGLLFTPGCAAELAEAIKRLCNNRDLVEYLANRAIVPRSIEDYVLQIEAVYEDVTVAPPMPIQNCEGMVGPDNI